MTDAATRDRYLGEACQSDPSLRAEVEALLGAYEDAGSFGEHPMGVAASTSVHLAPGSSLGPYRIDSLIEAGGMGQVYRACDTRLNRRVAGKVLPTYWADDAGMKERFDREAQAIALLNHPNICALHDVGTATPSPDAEPISFLVMEYLEGETLAARLERGPLRLHEVLDIAVPMADALDQAHRRGVVHRDLKPGNIMLTQSGPKLLDFGLARTPLKVRGGTGSGELATFGPVPAAPVTTPGLIIGTLPYMAPEQVEGREADVRTDIYSFGALLYEMATGQRPFRESNTAKIISQILVSDPPPMREIDEAVPPGLETVVRRCLAKDPEARWQHVRDVRWQLASLADAAAPAETGQRPLPLRGHTAWAAATLVVVVLTAWGASNGGPGDPATGTVEASVTLPNNALDPATNPAMALSPDGTELVFRSSGQLFRYRMDGSGIASIPGTENAHTPFFSPDGQYLGFLAPPAVMSVPLEGGRPTKICDAPYLSYASPGATWGEDGTIVFAAGLAGLMQVPADRETDPVPLTTPDDARKELLHYAPQFLPGGRELLFMVRTTDQRVRPAVLTMATGQWDWIDGLDDVFGPVHYVRSKHLVYAKAGQQNGGPARLEAVPFDLGERRVYGKTLPLGEVYTQKVLSAAVSQFTVSNSGLLVYVQGDRPKSSLVRVTRDGRFTPLTSEAHGYLYPQVAPDGTKVAVRIDASSGSDIHVVSVADGRLDQLTEFGTSSAPTWSPNGDRVYFAAAALDSIGYDIYSVPANEKGGRPQQELRREQGQFPTSWSPTAPVLAFYELGNDTARDIWTLGPAGVVSEVLKTAANERAASFSPDGRYIAYVSDTSGVDEVYILRYREGGEPVLVSREGGYEPLWSPRVGELFYRRGSDLMAVTIAEGRPAGPARPVLSGTYELSEPEAGRPNYDVFPDGESFVFVRPGESVAIRTLNLRVNWFEELRSSLSPQGRR